MPWQNKTDITAEDAEDAERKTEKTKTEYLFST
jgi:hypothetical protein